MKLNFNKEDTTKAVYAFFVVAAGILFYFFLRHLTQFFNGISFIISLLMPFIYAFCISYILNPLLKCFEGIYEKIFKKSKNARLKRAVSLIVTYLVTLLSVFFFIWVISPQIKDGIISISYKLTTWTPVAIEKILEYTNGIEISVDITEKLKDFLSNMGNKLLSYSKDSISGIWGGVVNITVFVYNILFGFIISIYMLSDKETFMRQSKKIVYACFKRRRGKKIIDTCSVANEIFKGFFIGKILDSLIMGILCLACMRIFKLPYASLVSFVFGVTNIIPYFGPILGAIIGTLIVFIESPMQSLWFLILALVLQQLDGNVIGPRILSNSTGISAFWVIFAIVVFGGLFGVIGMFIGVPTFAFIYALLKAFFSKRTDSEEQ